MSENLKSAILTDRACLNLGGEDVVPFLQNLITCDVENLEIGSMSFGALLTPQGKILFDFFLIKTDKGFLLDCGKDQREDLMKRLMFYRLRASVTISPNDCKVMVFWGGDIKQESNDICGTDPRDMKMGWRCYSSAQHRDTSHEPQEAWHENRIKIGIPASNNDFELGDAFPHEVLMDQTSGVDFSKGCYVGQEVVSRMQHRGTARNRLVCVSASSGDALPPRGTELEANGKTLGKMGSSAGNNGLAIARIDRVSAAQTDGIEITAAGLPLEITRPPYAAYPWGK